MAKIFIGMETSGQVRRRLVALGHHVISCDLLRSDDGADISLILVTGGQSGHLRGDVFDILKRLEELGWVPDAALFHPDCTYLTSSAEWAYKDPDFVRYPGVGYHQRLKPETLFGEKRRAARKAAIADWHRIDALPIARKIAENPAKGALSTGYRPPDQKVHPYQFGDDASKETGIWLWNAPKLVIDPARRVDGRLVPVSKAGVVTVDGWARGKGECAWVTHIERWANQTDKGFNNLTPGALRWQVRSKTYDGIADALVVSLTAPMED